MRLPLSQYLASAKSEVAASGKHTSPLLCSGFVRIIFYMAFKLQCKRCHRVLGGGSCRDGFCYQRMYHIPHAHCRCGNILQLEDMEIILSPIGY